MAEKDWTKIVIGIVAILVAAQLLGYDILGALGITGAGKVQQAPTATIIYKEPGTKERQVITVSETEVSVIDKYTGAAVKGIQIQFYERGADVKNPNIGPRFYTETDEQGIATIKRTLKSDGSEYDIYVNGNGSYYDIEIPSGTWKIEFNPYTGKGKLYVIEGGKESDVIRVTQVGAFTDLSIIPEASPSITVMSGKIIYNEAAGDGSAYFQIDIGNRKANSELHEVVLCFRDKDGDMEGDELTGLTATFVSGDTNIALESNLYGYWRDAMGGGTSCINVADVVGPGRKARYEIAMTINEEAWEADEEFIIVQDDLGDYKAKQYPSRNEKAAPSEVIVTIQE